jgi:hypothetical protein
MLIQEQHPELIKYLNEMPITIPDRSSPVINKKNLTDYYESLDCILKTYLEAHEYERAIGATRKKV